MQLKPHPLQHPHIYIYIPAHTVGRTALLILQVFLLTKHVEVCTFYHRYTSTVRDGILNKNPENHFVWLLSN
jgi:hypothetical protein